MGSGVKAEAVHWLRLPQALSLIPSTGVCLGEMEKDRWETNSEKKHSRTEPVCQASTLKSSLFNLE